ncbi:glycerol-3-phosphate dehydrogenase [Notoacmeibacter sp. MSK16QG-6]|uniref:glycerol-3-phosphate dehydrogenase n=1 Tax=Notoacmeibacter sp. MSK16QG-6 TaxID=2957982 RepID=UPI0020A18DF9|nr:glycerol-3-phosphate dehydrogenase [Notoacmeibacter sp. MSK16QG-6]MCP1199808.1 glycerol-3-phosphate dehydrogenase [Notoacmeibacter sp. MSK16QG-6]
MADDLQHDMPISDLLVIGGGVNGCGIARDAVGRGMSVVLVEMDDLASGTSSASTKLFHGGLRYLEYFEIKLVREALSEREVLLRAMPHISWPMRFVLPYTDTMRFENDTPTSKLLSTVMPWMKGRRPAWLIRAGLFMYDTLGGRKFLPGTESVDLSSDPVGEPLKDEFKEAFEYSDCWVEDSRLVALNARDAAERGASVLTRTKLIDAERHAGEWRVTLENVETGERFTRRARMLANAAGPWVRDLINRTASSDLNTDVRLVKGSHIVTRKLYDHDKAYFLQGKDGRIIFLIPYESDYTLIGTTDAGHDDPNKPVEISDEERDYLLNFANEYLKQKITVDDIVWTYSGVRPLYDDGASSATAATREYVLVMDDEDGAPVLNVFGGKITTYRRLAEQAIDRLTEDNSHVGKSWTAGVPLPGGDFPVDGVDELIGALQEKYAFLGGKWAARLVRAYGTDADHVLNGATSKADLGEMFGATLSAREVEWLMEKEFARTAHDVIWRRSKLGLRMSDEEVRRLDAFMVEKGGIPNAATSVKAAE